MKLGHITEYIDVAQVTLYFFFAFFIGLLLYLRREDRREGYPLFSEPSNTYRPEGIMFIPPPKVFKLPHGGTYSAPNKPDERPMRAEKVGVYPGAPLHPTGDPMLAAVGPGSYAERQNVPDMTHEGQPKIVPMRVATGYAVAEKDPDPRGMDLIGGDRGTAGKITDIWVDRSECIIRYLEADVGGRRVLIPMTFAKVKRGNVRVPGQVVVNALMSDQFGQVPSLANADQITLLEEDKVCAYYGAGTLYATPSRTESLL
jgi:photosynthetic reaction center H subunit